MDQQPSQVIFTNKARCRDCYRCLKACPVKAIKMDKNQAYVIDELCIVCGTCIKECPQKAKDYRREIGKARELLASGQPIAVSIGPSFVATFNEDEQKKIPALLRKLGFNYIAETSVGAYQVARRSSELSIANPQKAHIATACPAVINYIEKYRPELTGNLLQVISPMLAHARHLKYKLGSDYRIIFIGPCLAKKSEAERPEAAGLIDAVLTFEELKEWITESNIDWNSLPVEKFDEEPAPVARLFPAAGGLMKTASLATDLLSREVIALSGFSELNDLLYSLDSEPHPVLIEPLFCHHGCLNGPGIATDLNIYQRRQSLLRYAHSTQSDTREHLELTKELTNKDLTVKFKPYRFSSKYEITEEMIQKVFEETGKSNPDDQLNCGTCGYNSCRDKAIAVIRGMAVKEICLPSMRRLSDIRNDIILESYPNGVVILDEQFNISMINSAFKKLFMCSNAVLGKRISYLMDAEQFELLAAGEKKIHESDVVYSSYNLICHQILYSLIEEKKYVGIFMNITDQQQNLDTLKQLKSETLKQAQELLDLQISMSQKLAEYLGETTAQSETILQNLVKLTYDQQQDLTKGK